MDRRQFLKFGGTSSAIGMLTGSSVMGLLDTANAATDDYRVLVCIFLSGGNDGNDTLIPVDAGYNDYSKAHADLSLAKDSLIRLSGISGGREFGLNPALSPLAPLYNQGRLSWIANVGALIQPTTTQQVLEYSAILPPFLGSHNEQQKFQQGWLGDEESSGWAGRSLELLPSSLISSVSAVTMNTNRTLVLGKKSSVAFLSQNDSRYWGAADLAQPNQIGTQTLNRMTQWQFKNEYQAEYMRTLKATIRDSTIFTQASLTAREPAASFESNELALSLKKVASIIPEMKKMGIKRQVVLIQWGSFDTHSGQRGTGTGAQDGQLASLGKALAAFDQANVAAGMNLNVTTAVLSEFGRTLRPASGGGTDHAWGNHWMVMGGPVIGGRVFGKFPSLVLGGVDDSDPGAGGRFVPSTSTDQFGASLMQWLGLPTSQFTTAFPNLKNFSEKTLPFMKL